MNLSGPGITYIFLIIPTIFAVVVIVQGLVKMVRHETNGPIITAVGFGFIGIIVAAYFFFIR